MMPPLPIIDCGRRYVLALHSAHLNQVAISNRLVAAVYLLLVLFRNLDGMATGSGRPGRAGTAKADDGRRKSSVDGDLGFNGKGLGQDGLDCG